MPSAEDLLAAAKEAATHGQKDVARQYLRQLVQQQPDSEEGWVWLASLATDLAEMQHYLENALLINPESPQALAGMEWMHKHQIKTLPSRQTADLMGGDAAPPS